MENVRDPARRTQTHRDGRFVAPLAVLLTFKPNGGRLVLQIEFGSYVETDVRLLFRRSRLDCDVIGDVQDEDQIKPIRWIGEREDA